MKTCAVLIIAAIFASGNVAYCADRANQSGPDVEQSYEARGRIATLAWNQSNIETLRSLDKAAVLKFLNEGRDTDLQLTPSDIGEFRWFDPAGDGKYELATIGQSRCCVWLCLYWQEAPGKFRVHCYGGASDLKDTIRDLNGDGKKELILYAYVPGEQQSTGAEEQATWPQVYQLENGKYVEASRDFPKFYDDEVLPQLKKKIAEARDTYPAFYGVRIMERDKILRVLGRDPTAGLQQAREWAASSDPDLIDDATIVFRDIGGYEDEARAADAALKRALALRRGKN
jgi:hypothetical protein